MKKKTVAIIPARLDSTRLPGKVLLKMKNKEMLYFLAKRLEGVKDIDTIVLYTTKRDCDIPLVRWAEMNNLNFYRGDLNDLLGSFYRAALEFKADIIVKANGDCPLLAPEAIDVGLKQIENEECEFLTGKNKYTGLPVGAGAEIITISALEKLNNLAETAYHRDNITAYIFDNLDEFGWGPIKVPKTWKALEMIWTLDTIDDFNRIRTLIEKLRDNNPGAWRIEKIIQVYKKYIKK